MIDQSQLLAYQRDGFFNVKAVFTPAEITDLCAEVDRLWQAADKSGGDPAIHWRQHVDGSRKPDRIDPITERSQLFATLATDQRLMAMAAAVIGGPAALFKDKLICKWPGNFGYGVHQDYPYWADWQGFTLPVSGIFSMMIALDPATPQNGALQLWPGLHQQGQLPSDPREPRDIDPQALPEDQVVTVSMAAGDVLLHHSMAPHRSMPNLSAIPRRAVFLVYCAASHGAMRAGYYSRHQITKTLSAVGQ
jgi:2-aminoethylphosphonate dioxygenase